MWFPGFRLCHYARSFTPADRQPAQTFGNSALHQGHSCASGDRVPEREKLRKLSSEIATRRMETQSSSFPVGARIECLFRFQRKCVYAEDELYSFEPRARGL